MTVATTSEEQLLEFLYACPVGLVECDLVGDIGMMNPHAMQHLLPLAGARDAGNLFSAFERHAPELRSMVAAFATATGRICDGHRIFVDLGASRRSAAPKVLGCTLVKLGPNRLMATIADVSQQVAQEQRLKQADTWFATLLDGINDYATLAITSEGKIEAANACFTRQTGHDWASVAGRDLAEILAVDRAGGDLRLDEQLLVARRDGWHLQEGGSTARMAIATGASGWSSRARQHRRRRRQASRSSCATSHAGKLRSRICDDSSPATS